MTVKVFVVQLACLPETCDKVLVANLGAFNRGN